MRSVAISKERQEFTPGLYRCTSGVNVGIIVMMTRFHPRDIDQQWEGEGVIVHGDSMSPGYYSKLWSMNMFEPFYGKVELHGFE